MNSHLGKWWNIPGQREQWSLRDVIPPCANQGWAPGCTQAVLQISFAIDRAEALKCQQHKHKLHPAIFTDHLSAISRNQHLYQELGNEGKLTEKPHTEVN